MNENASSQLRSRSRSQSKSWSLAQRSGSDICNKYVNEMSKSTNGCDDDDGEGLGDDSNTRTRYS